MANISHRTFEWVTQIHAINEYMQAFTLTTQDKGGPREKKFSSELKMTTHELETYLASLKGHTQYVCICIVWIGFFSVFLFFTHVSHRIWYNCKQINHFFRNQWFWITWTEKRKQMVNIDRLIILFQLRLLFLYDFWLTWFT